MATAAKVGRGFGTLVGLLHDDNDDDGDEEEVDGSTKVDDEDDYDDHDDHVHEKDGD